MKFSHPCFLMAQRKTLHSDLTVYVKFPISATDGSTHNTLEADLKSLNTELVDTMAEIKSVSRKERQVRGKLSEMKLEQSGFADLANNPEMLKLITIE